MPARAALKNQFNYFKEQKEMLRPFARTNHIPAISVIGSGSTAWEMSMSDGTGRFSTSGRNGKVDKSARRKCDVSILADGRRVDFPGVLQILLQLVESRLLQCLLQ